MKNYFLVKMKTHDGTEIMNPDKIRCTLIYGFDPIKGCEVAQAIVNNFDAEILEDASLYAATKIGLYFKGTEHKDGTAFDQQWLLAYDPNVIDEEDNMNMTQSHLFEGM